MFHENVMTYEQTYFILEYVGPLNAYLKDPFVSHNYRFIDTDFDTEVWEWKSFERARRFPTKQLAVDAFDKILVPDAEYIENLKERAQFLTGFVITEVHASYTCKPGETIPLARQTS